MKYIKYRFTVIGGDKRMAVIAKRLVSRGHTVFAYMLSEDLSSYGITVCSTLEKAIESVEFLILPHPISRDNINIFSLHASSNVRIDDVFKCAKNHGVKFVLAGNVNQSIASSALNQNVSLIDYSSNKEFLLKNAQATAEGAIMIAMENSDITLKDSHILVCGFGRISQHLINLLKSFGASITIAARSDDAISKISELGFKSVKIGCPDSIDALRYEVEKSDLIFNTVPALIFNSSIIGKADSVTYIELASCPGGIDLTGARNIGMKVIFAPSLPGRCFPESSGGYILDSIYDSMKERGIFI